MTSPMALTLCLLDQHLNH